MPIGMRLEHDSILWNPDTTDEDYQPFALIAKGPDLVERVANAVRDEHDIEAVDLSVSIHNALAKSFSVSAKVDGHDVRYLLVRAWKY